MTMTADQAGLDLDRELRAMIERRRTAGAFSAAGVAVAADSGPLVSFVVGELAAYDDDGEALAPDRREPAGPDTYFDLASLTKAFSAHTLLMLVERGLLGLDRPLAEDLPAYATAQKAGVTLRHLLTHTSGLPPTWDGWRPAVRDVLARRSGCEPLQRSPVSDRAALVDDLLALPLEAPPATRFAYSCVGFNTAMALAEQVTGRAWTELVTEQTLVPLGLDEQITFTPPVSRTAATELQPELQRGVVRAQVHDETAWALGGAANAGLFGTLDGVRDYFEIIRAGADDITRTLLWANQLPALLGRDRSEHSEAGFGQSLGLRIGDRGAMGARGGEARGHTGFTGTSAQTDRRAGLTIVVLTNRVHPSRDGIGIDGLRAEIADVVYDALG